MYRKMNKSERNLTSAMAITAPPYFLLSCFKLMQTHKTTVAIAAKVKATPKIMASSTVYIREKCDDHDITTLPFVTCWITRRMARKTHAVS